MDTVLKEQIKLNNRKMELERQLEARALTENQEQQIRNLSQKMKSGLSSLDFNGKQELRRLLIETVKSDGQKIEIQTVLTLADELNPTHREGARG
jgi:Spy/CpxP family protein refolding chaperone